MQEQLIRRKQNPISHHTHYDQDCNKIRKCNLKALFQILMIESDKRSLNDIKQLKEILCDVEALKKLQSTSELDYICRELALIRLKNSEFVFQKDKGKLYIILQGSVGIYTRDEAILDEVHTLTATDCFGELIEGNSRDAKHNFIALSLENSILAVITGEAYRRFQQIENHQQNSVEESIREFKPFAKLSKEQIEGLSKKSSLSKVASHTVVIREGELPKALFLVRKGILKMCRNVKFARCNDTGDHTNAFTYQTKTFCVKQLTTGDYFPLSQLKSRMPVQSTIISACPCELVLIPYKQIQSLLKILESQADQLTDNQIRQQYSFKLEWDCYKNRFIDSLYADINNRKSVGKHRQPLKPVKNTTKPSFC